MDRPLAHPCDRAQGRRGEEVEPLVRSQLRAPCVPDDRGEQQAAQARARQDQVSMGIGTIGLRSLHAAKPNRKQRVSEQEIAGVGKILYRCLRELDNGSTCLLWKPADAENLKPRPV